MVWLCKGSCYQGKLFVAKLSLKVEVYDVNDSGTDDDIALFVRKGMRLAGFVSRRRNE